MGIMVRKVFILLAIILLCLSCRLEQDIDFDFPEGEAIPIVEAYLVKGEEMQISLSRSNTLYEAVKINPIWNAEVYIVHDGDSVRLRNVFKYDDVRGHFYNYISDTKVNGESGFYELSIKSKEFGDMSASCAAVSDVSIDGIELDGSGLLRVNSWNVSDANNNYYLLRLTAYLSGIIEDRKEVEFDFYEKGEGDIEMFYPIDFDSYDSLGVELCRIDSLTYVYRRSVWNALNANRDPYTTASPFFGNVEGAWGIFGFVSCAREVLVSGS